MKRTKNEEKSIYSFVLDRNTKYQENRMKIISYHVELMSGCKSASQSKMINWFNSS